MINLAAAEADYIELISLAEQVVNTADAGSVNEIGMRYKIALSKWVGHYAPALLALAKRGEELRALCEKLDHAYTSLGGMMSMDYIDVLLDLIRYVRSLKGSEDAE